MLPTTSAGTTYFKLPASSTSYLNQLTASGRSRDLTVTIAVAMVASTMVPNAETDDPLQTFGSQAAVPALDFINMVNSIAPIDFRQAMELMRNFYVQRQEAFRCPFFASTPTNKEGLAAVFGLSKHIPTNVLEVLNNESRSVMVHYCEFAEVARVVLKKD